MNGFKIDIEKATLENTNFRQVLYTAKHSQIVLMSLLPGEEIGLETHKNNDQFFRFELGEGLCLVENNVYHITNGTAILVPAGAKHNIINNSKTNLLKFYTIYSPPHHEDKTIHQTKKIARIDKEKFTGQITENN